ncbi:hypothetical protein [Micromonospora echinofusca]|uniref:Uncharacterized protein n=1 Tax=Micromonospora echinofusca TaxID=47858 RepID=A0ABS3VMW3_MICEH|nr:hypothetical protein [Micromonospora echinofusca]MBO4205877.1 hypothetical protein [Micromonospora echinofusca]
MGADIAALLAVLAETRTHLARPDNDFSWSSFQDTAGALEELDELTTIVRAGGPVPFGLTILFAPTGPIQEVSLSSGWGDEFVALADRFDAAMAGHPDPQS